MSFKPLSIKAKYPYEYDPEDHESIDKMMKWMFAQDKIENPIRHTWSVESSYVDECGWETCGGNRYSPLLFDSEEDAQEYINNNRTVNGESVYRIVYKKMEYLSDGHILTTKWVSDNGQ